MGFTHYAIQNAEGKVVRHWHLTFDPECRYCKNGVPFDPKPEVGETPQGSRITLSNWVDQDA